MPAPESSPESSRSGPRPPPLRGEPRLDQPSREGVGSDMVAQQRAPPNPATRLLSVAEEGAKNKGSQALQASDTLPPTQGEEAGLVPSSSSAAKAPSSPDAEWQSEQELADPRSVPAHSGSQPKPHAAKLEERAGGAEEPEAEMPKTTEEKAQTEAVWVAAVGTGQEEAGAKATAESFTGGIDPGGDQPHNDDKNSVEPAAQVRVGKWLNDERATAAEEKAPKMAQHGDTVQGGLAEAAGDATAAEEKAHKLAQQEDTDQVGLAETTGAGVVGGATTSS